LSGPPGHPLAAPPGHPLAALLRPGILLARPGFIPARSFVGQPPTYTETYAAQWFQASPSGFSTAWNYLAVTALLF
jgi:hypothetical protein